MGNNQNGFDITQAGMPHLELVTPLFDQYRQFYGHDSDENLARLFIRARFEHLDSVVFLAVEGEDFDETALGFLLMYPTFNSRLARPIWIVNDLFVIPDARGRGIGKALMERGRQLALNTGAKQLNLATGVDNTSSHTFYESLGYKPDTQFRHYVLEL